MYFSVRLFYRLFPWLPLFTGGTGSNTNTGTMTGNMNNGTNSGNIGTGNTINRELFHMLLGGFDQFITIIIIIIIFMGLYSFSSIFTFQQLERTAQWKLETSPILMSEPTTETLVRRKISFICLTAQSNRCVRMTCLLILPAPLSLYKYIRHFPIMHWTHPFFLSPF